MPPNEAVGASNGKLPPSSFAVSLILDEIAGRLEAQGANPYRVRAYRLAAQTLRDVRTPVADILRAHGVEGLRLLPHVGASISCSI